MVAAAFLLAAALSAPQSGVPPWTDLEPAIRDAEWLLVAEVKEVHVIEGLGLQVRVKVNEALAGGRRSGEELAYLGDASAIVKPGERQLLFLAPPPPGGWHAQLRQRVGGADPNLAHKIEWLRAVLALRRLPAEQRGAGFVRHYQEGLAAAAAWTRERALVELERLQRERPEELRALLSATAVAAAAAGASEPAFRRRLEALAAWLEAPPG